MFKIKFIGTSKEEIIEAENLNSAKWIFAIKNNLKSISYIKGSKIK